MANQDAVMYVIITIDADHQIATFPDPLRAKPGDTLAWHCNPAPGQREVSGEFTITMGDPNPFEHHHRHGQIGGRTKKTTVRADAQAMPYPYRIEVDGQTIDPEIIIEQGPPKPPSKGSKTSRDSKHSKPSKGSKAQKQSEPEPDPKRKPKR
jgi:hypothetical protein